MTGGMLAFVEHPDEWEKLLRNPALIESAVEEIVRWKAPVIQFCRTAKQDYTLRGQTIRAGEAACLFYPSGCRDEEVFPDGDVFRIDRTPNDHVGFGRGERVSARISHASNCARCSRTCANDSKLELAGRVDR